MWGTAGDRVPDERGEPEAGADDLELCTPKLADVEGEMKLATQGIPDGGPYLRARSLTGAGTKVAVDEPAIVGCPPVANM